MERMLSTHIQSMFEYLAPRRGGGGGGGAHAAQLPLPPPQQQPKPANEGYKDMVY